MKPLFITAALALCAFFTGCNPTGSNSYELTIRTLNTVEEKAANGDITVTEYQWTEDYLPAGEVCTFNGVKVYEHTDYTYPDSGMIFYRTDYTGGIESGYYKHIYEYTSANRDHVKAIKIYSVDGGETLVESKIESYDSYGRVSEYVHWKDGSTILKYDGYIYGGQYIKYDVWDYSTIPETHTVSTTHYSDNYYSTKYSVAIAAPDGDRISRTDYFYFNGYYAGYTKYKYIGDEAVAVEKQTDYTVSSDSSTVTFVIVSYLDDGVTETSRVTTKQTFDISKITVNR